MIFILLTIYCHEAHCVYFRNFIIFCRIYRIAIFVIFPFVNYYSISIDRKILLLKLFVALTLFVKNISICLLSDLLYNPVFIIVGICIVKY